MSGEGWGSPLSCSELIEADDDDGDGDATLERMDSSLFIQLNLPDCGHLMSPTNSSHILTHACSADCRSHPSFCRHKHIINFRDQIAFFIRLFPLGNYYILPWPRGGRVNHGPLVSYLCKWSEAKGREIVLK